MATTFVSFSEAVAFFIFFFPSILSSFLYSVIKIFETNQLKKGPWTFYDHDKNIHGRFMTMGLFVEKNAFFMKIPESRINTGGCRLMDVLRP